MSELNRYQKRQLQGRIKRNLKMLANSPSEYVSTQEIADLAGVTRICASVWQSRYEDFPELVTVGNTRGKPKYYRKSEVIAWLKNREDKRYKFASLS